jgi:hypothetical protein
VLPAAAIAGVVVGAVAVAANLLSPNGSGATSLSQAISNLPKSKSITLLEQERQQIIAMNAATSTMTTATKATTISPSQIASAQQASSPSSSNSNSGSGSSSNTSGSSSSQNTQAVAAPNPGSAQSIAYGMMSSFGFSPSSQWQCLDETWQKESSWQYDAENASGAYGIPQALPASKMSSAGSDYLTNVSTQIKWGLGYISSVYGTPCNAWAHEVNDGWY